jgi:hypothetical protein
MSERARPIQMKFYVTEEERNFIHKKMAMMNVTNQSAYLRKMAVDGMLIKVDYSNFDKMANDISGMTKNINQIAKRINSTETIYAGDIRQIKEKQEEIWQLLKSTLSALL